MTNTAGEFVRLNNGDYERKTERGSFLIWREGRYWKARYWSDETNKSGEHKEHYFLPMRMKFRDIVTICKKDLHWCEMAKKTTVE